MKRPPNNRRRDQPQQRPPSRQQPVVVDIWIDPPSLPELVPIATAANALAMFRSLGAPPVHGQGDVARVFEAVIERSAVIAAALALSAGALDGHQV